MKTKINNELFQIWIARYLPGLGTISNHVRKHIEQRLKIAISDKSRQITSDKIRNNLSIDCNLAAVDTYQLLVAAGISIDTWDLQNLSIQIHAIYEKLIDCYEQSFIFSPILDCLHTIESEAGRLQAASLVIPEFETLMLTIGPILRELKAIYFSSINQHLIGFMTTHMHFLRQRILSHLDPDEDIWLAPYLQLLDELTCMPWQRICLVASTPNIHNPDVLSLVKKMIPKISLVLIPTHFV